MTATPTAAPINGHEERFRRLGGVVEAVLVALLFDEVEIASVAFSVVATVVAIVVGMESVCKSKDNFYPCLFEVRRRNGFTRFFNNRCACW